MATASENNPIKGLADEELKGKLKLRHLMSEGMLDAHCFISNAAQQPLSGDGEVEKSDFNCNAEEGTDVNSVLPDVRSPCKSQPATTEDVPPETPRPSPFTPREGGEISEAAAEDQGEKVQYEWQFDILSSFPRDKAITLVEHLRRSERERAQATAAALQLQRSNGELQRQLDAAVSILQEKDPSHPGLAALLAEAHAETQDVVSERTSRCCGHFLRQALFVLLVVAVLLMPIAAFVLLASASVSSPVPAEQCRPDRHAETRLLGLERAAPQAAAEGLEDTRRSLSACEAKLRDAPAGLPAGGDRTKNTPGGEAVLTEDESEGKPEADPALVAKLSEENAAMRGQLERLWLDIEKAVEQKQEMVCWKL